MQIVPWTGPAHQPPGVPPPPLALPLIAPDTPIGVCQLDPTHVRVCALASSNNNNNSSVCRFEPLGWGTLSGGTRCRCGHELIFKT